jgi:paraquat-inducible protein A
LNAAMSSDPKGSGQANYESCCICDQCDLLVDVGELPAGHRARCPRCGFVLSRAYAHAVDRMLIFAITAVVCLLFSNLFGFVNLALQGREREITLLETAQELFKLNELALAAFLLVVIIGLPTIFAALISWLALAIKLKRVSARTINVLRTIGYLRFWNMAEIFFLGILISMVKIASMAQVAVGFSFWSYAMFNVSLIAAMMHLDKFQITQLIRKAVRERQVVPDGD